ncbi:hypothetical protein LRP88_12357 [Fusarium phalaenopsidis]
MKFPVVLALASIVCALPASEKRQTYVPCTGLYGTSQCCATDILGLANLDCGNLPSAPRSVKELAAAFCPL